MNLSEEQRIAVAKVLVDIMVSDGEIDQSEVRIMKAMQNRLGITGEDMEDAMDMEDDECKQHLTGLSEADKVEFGQVFNEMLHADDHPHDAEYMELKRFCTGTGIPLPD